MVDINLNCDMAEGYGVYSIGSDEELLQVVQSANVAWAVIQARCAAL